jgi:cation diffusion facilitator family transporter
VVINGALGWYLLRIGRNTGAIILEANGRHVLTDVWTSSGAIVGLVLAMTTGWLYWDPIIAIVLALNILGTSYRLIRKVIHGLMDQVDPKVMVRLTKVLERECEARRIGYHELRCRNLGNSWWVDLHLLFARGTTIERAHEVASQVEEVVKASLPGRVSVITHMEPKEGHDLTHREPQAEFNPEAEL